MHIKVATTFTSPDYIIPQQVILPLRTWQRLTNDSCLCALSFDWDFPQTEMNQIARLKGSKVSLFCMRTMKSSSWSKDSSGTHPLHLGTKFIFLDDPVCVLYHVHFWMKGKSPILTSTGYSGQEELFTPTRNTFLCYFRLTYLKRNWQIKCRSES